MRIAVEGCAHGELERIYEVIKILEDQNNYKVDLLICCGDFQSTRNLSDLCCMAVKAKFLDICSFYKYYNGEKVAPIPTIFIGGNHEASNYLQELSYGGWVAPNIYYMGYANVIKVNGIRIGGISGIFKGYDYRKGHFEFPPYSRDSLTSVYHIRSLEVFRLKQLTPKIDVMLSHDWPTRVTDYGNVQQLLRFKPFFREDIENGKLGSQPCEDLLHLLKPKHWFSAHLHCRFTATIKHSDDEQTNFLALDKCLPNRRFLEIVDIETPNNTDGELEFSYDLEWLTILYLTNNLLNVKSYYTKLPQDGDDSRTNFTPTQEEMDVVLKKFNNDLKIPKNFTKTVPAFNPQTDFRQMKYCQNLEVQPELNPQTSEFCEKLNIDDPLFLALSFAGKDMSQLSINTSCAETELNSSLNESSFDVSTTEADLSFSKKAPLSSFLPKPKWTNDEEINLDSDDDDEEVKPAEKSSEKTESVVDTSQTSINSSQDSLKRDLSLLNCDSTLETSAVESKDTTIVAETPGKKFKRRNQTIYAADDE